MQRYKLRSSSWCLYVHECPWKDRPYETFCEDSDIGGHSKTPDFQYPVVGNNMTDAPSCEASATPATLNMLEVTYPS